MKRLSIIIALFALATGSISAQKIVVVSGDLKSLKSQAFVNVVYTYEDLMVGKLTEGEYLEKKVREYNEKEPGKGDKFKASWESDRDGRYHPKFEELINKYAPMNFGKHPDADVTMHIEISFLEPGYNIGVSKKSASMNCFITITDKAGTELCKIDVKNAPGNGAGGYDYEVGMRVQECYAIAGKRLGGMIAKACK